MTAQIMAVAVFVIMFILIVSEKIERQWASLACGALILIVVFGICMHDKGAVLETLNIKAFIEPGFWYAKAAAEEGKSFVVIGRCAEHVLRDFPAMVSVFVLGNKDEKCDRIMKKYSLNREEALRLMKRKDAARKSYHNYYCGSKWGDSRNYDLCIKSSDLGVDGTAELIDQYIIRRIGNRGQEQAP